MAIVLDFCQFGSWVQTGSQKLDNYYAGYRYEEIFLYIENMSTSVTAYRIKFAENGSCATGFWSAHEFSTDIVWSQSEICSEKHK